MQFVPKCSRASTLCKTMRHEHQPLGSAQGTENKAIVQWNAWAGAMLMSRKLRDLQKHVFLPQVFPGLKNWRVPETLKGQLFPAQKGIRNLRIVENLFGSINLSSSSGIPSGVSGPEKLREFRKTMIPSTRGVFLSPKVTWRGHN